MTGLRKEVEIRFAHSLGFGLAAEIFQVGRIGHGLSAGGVFGVNAIRQVVNQRPQQETFPVQFNGAGCHPLFHFVVRLAQGGLCLLSIRNIPADAHQPDDLPVLVPQRYLGGLQPASFLGSRIHRHFFPIQRLARFHHGPFVIKKLIGHFCGKEVEVGFANQLIRAGRTQGVYVRRIVYQKTALPVFDENAIWQAVNQRPQQVVLTRMPRVILIPRPACFRSRRSFQTRHRPSVCIFWRTVAVWQRHFFALCCIHAQI